MKVRKLCLLLLHPSVVSNPNLLKQTKENPIFAQAETIDQYLIDKIKDSSINLENRQYDIIWYLTPEEPDKLVFPKDLIPVLVRLLRDDGELYGLSDKYKIDAFLAGFRVHRESENNYVWRKNPILKSSSNSLVSLEKRGSYTTLLSQNLPRFRRCTNVDSQITAKVVDTHDLQEHIDIDDSIVSLVKLKCFDQVENDDDSISEEELVEDQQDNMITIITCGKTQIRRRKACKDCSCGLKEQEEQNLNDIRTRRTEQLLAATKVKLLEHELREIDFTIEGKTLGGCGSCSLGDAFRCSGCPYLGLPAFKPGEHISITSITDDL